MPAIGFLKRTRSLRSQRAGGPPDTPIGSISSYETRNAQVPEGSRLTTDPSESGNTYRSTSPIVLDRAMDNRHGSTENDLSSSTESRTNDAFLDAKTIGLALGSPSQNQLPFAPTEDSSRNRQVRLNTPESASTARFGTSESGSNLELQKPRMIKWRSFGGFFSRKRTPSPSARVYQVQPSSTDVISERGRPRYLALGQIRSSEDQVTRAQRPLVLPSQQGHLVQTPSATAVQDQEDYASLSRSAIDSSDGEFEQENAPGTPEFWHSLTFPISERQVEVPTSLTDAIVDQLDAPIFQCKGGSLLEVEIPSVQLERYSVMFENLLQQPPSSTLLVRRQGTTKVGTSKEGSSEKVKTEGVVHRLPLSRSQPDSLARPSSAAFSRAFPPLDISTSAKQIQGSKSLHRSLTSPSLTTPKGRYVASPLSKNTEPGLSLLEVNEYKDNLTTCRQQGRRACPHISDHSRTSTVNSFHTAPESSSTDSIPRPSIPQQSLLIPTLNRPKGHLAQHSGNGEDLVPNPVAPTSFDLTRDKDADAQRGKEGRGTVAADRWVSASVPTSPYAERPQERKLPHSLRPSKSGLLTQGRPAQTSSSELAQQAAKAAASLAPDGQEHNTNTASTVLPLSSHPPSPTLRSKYSTGVTRKPQAGRIRTATTSAPATPYPSSPKITPDTVNSKFTEPRTPKAAAFNPTPSTTPSSLLPQLPPGLPTPEELKGAADISIARQISTSRRQRELLAPLRARHARQPTLVDVSPRASHSRGSHHLVLEHA